MDTKIRIDDDVLIIDDDNDFDFLLEEILHDAGCVTYVCTTLSEAEKQIRDERFDVVILDLAFPDESPDRAAGLEFAQKAKAQRPDIGIIVVSNNTEKDILLKAINIGVDKFLPKTTSPKELIDVVAATAEVAKEKEFQKILIEVFAKLGDAYDQAQSAMEEVTLILKESQAHGV